VKERAMTLPEFLVDHPDGEVRFVGHRISLYDVVAAYQGGDTTPEALHKHFPTVATSLFRDFLAFYAANRTDVDAYASEYRAEMDRLRAPAVGSSR
jgi:uncharacterized protein (DUF433 family)